MTHDPTRGAAVGMIQRKLHPPERDARSVERARITRLLRELQGTYGFVWVTGTAGSGKTTAVLDAVAVEGVPLAWLTLDATEAAPGRLLVYLEAALRTAVPDVPAAASDALARDLSHSEAAGLLAEALDDVPMTLVLDELERIHESAAAQDTLSAFLRYLPSSVTVIAISRRNINVRLGARRELDGVGRISEEHLAFTVDEAVAALDAFGASTTDVASAVEATGGWVAGILFEAWRSPQHVHGLGGESDGLNSYLSSEIMESLSPDEHDFIVDTSLLPEVNAEAALALGLDNAALLLDRLRGRRLPVTFSADRTTMRCHARFREFLQEELRKAEPERVRSLTRAYGELLVREGHLEEALNAFLAARDLEAAESIAERAVPLVLQRQDLSVVERWLNTFGPAAVEQSPTLTRIQLSHAVERERWLLGAECADRLLAAPDVDELDPDVAVTIASCYHQVSRLDEALAVLSRAPGVPQTNAMRFAISVDLVGEQTHYRDRPADCGNPAVDGMLARHDFSHGRLERLLSPPEAPSPTAVAQQIAALRALGRLDEALELLQQQPKADSGAWTMTRVYTELMADLGRPEEARAALRSGRQAVVRSGSGFRMFELLLEVSLRLRFDRDTVAAKAALDEVESEPTASRRRRIVEQVQTYRGLIALQENRDEDAATILREAVELMVRWDRLLFLPEAATYLSEAEWRLENEDAADAAADVAIGASRRMGSDHLLLRAAREFPAVVSRRLDAEIEADSRWHELGRKLMSSGHITLTVAVPKVWVQEFGDLSITVDGHPVRLKLTKSAEVLAYLAAHGAVATKGDLLDALFASRSDDSARSYLRQALNRLRQALPEDAPLTVSADEVCWEVPEMLASESVTLINRLQQAQVLTGRARLTATLEALAKVDGFYLPEVRSRWSDARRGELEIVINDAKHDASAAAFELAEYSLAGSLVQQVLSRDPYRETSWRLSMRIAAALGADDRVVARFRECERTLQGIGTEPSQSTRQLLDRLRR